MHIFTLFRIWGYQRQYSDEITEDEPKVHLRQPWCYSGLPCFSSLLFPDWQMWHDVTHVYKCNIQTYMAFFNLTLRQVFIFILDHSRPVKLPVATMRQEEVNWCTKLYRCSTVSTFLIPPKIWSAVNHGAWWFAIRHNIHVRLYTTSCWWWVGSTLEPFISWSCHMILRVETNYFFCHLADFWIQDASSMDCPGWYLRNVRQSIH